MEKLIAYLTKNFVSVVAITFLTGATVTTSVLGMAKVADTVGKQKLEVPEVREAESSSPPSSSSQGTAQVSGGNSSSSVSSHPSFIKGTAAIVTGSSSSSTSGPQASTGCIITLFGKQYDVTTLQNTHSGGNVFNCGTDMTAVYQGQHGSDVSRMQKYLVASGSGGPTGSSTIQSNFTSSAQATSNGGEKEERDDKRNEDHTEEERNQSDSEL